MNKGLLARAYERYYYRFGSMPVEQDTLEDLVVEVALEPDPPTEDIPYRVTEADIITEVIPKVKFEELIRKARMR